MKLVILGSGTTIPSATRSAPAYLLEVDRKLILLDSGEGTKRRMVEAGRNPLDIDYIFYTHTHVDHVAELPAILWGFNWQERPRTRELVILGPVGFREFFDKMLSAFWPQFRKKAKFEVVIRELSQERRQMENIFVSTILLDKQNNTLVPYSVGYRIEYQGKIFVFTGDVGNNKNVVLLAKEADVLLIESSSPSPQEGHLTPGQAGSLALSAGVEKLILTHFYPAVEKIDILSEAKRNFKKEIILAEDLMEIKI